jgi:hypothetical protein
MSHLFWLEHVHVHVHVKRIQHLFPKPRIHSKAARSLLGPGHKKIRVKPVANLCRYFECGKMNCIPVPGELIQPEKFCKSNKEVQRPTG